MAFWVASVSVLTLGTSILAMFDTIGSIVEDDAPRRERGRVRNFLQAVRQNLVRGIPFSFVIAFIIGNTYMYFTIAVSGKIGFVLGGLIGLYGSIFVVSFIFRSAYLMTRNDIGPLTSVRITGRTWLDYPNFTILQIWIMTIAMIGSVSFPVGLMLLLPGGLVLFEVLSYEELLNTDIRAVIDRYSNSE